MRIPFRQKLRLGTDIIAVKRILDYTAPDSEKLQRLTKRFLHLKELQDLGSRFPWYRELETRGQTDNQNLANWVAGRWAAKEAAKKAWGASRISWKDLRVEPNPNTGQPVIVCNPSPTSVQDSTEQEALLSISHDGEYAVATVIAAPLQASILEDLKKNKAEAQSRRVAFRSLNQQEQEEHKESESTGSDRAKDG